MSRATTTAAVVGICPADPVELEARRSALSWITSGAPLYREAGPAIPPRHLVSYLALVDKEVGAILLVDHRKAGHWLPPGGHVEPGEDPLAAARREAREEVAVEVGLVSGLTSNPLFVSEKETVGAEPGHVDVVLWYVGSGHADQEISYDSREISEARWWLFDAAADESRSDPALRRFLRKLTSELSGSSHLETTWR